MDSPFSPLRDPHPKDELYKEALPYDSSRDYQEFINKLKLKNFFLREDPSPEMKMRSITLERLILTFFDTMLREDRKTTNTVNFKLWIEEYALYADNVATFWKKLHRVFTKFATALGDDPKLRDHFDAVYEYARDTMDLVVSLYRSAPVADYGHRSAETKAALAVIKHAMETDTRLDSNFVHSTRLAHDPDAVRHLTNMLAEYNNVQTGSVTTIHAVVDALVESVAGRTEYTKITDSRSAAARFMTIDVLQMIYAAPPEDDAVYQFRPQPFDREGHMLQSQVLEHMRVERIVGHFNG